MEVSPAADQLVPAVPIAVGYEATARFALANRTSKAIRIADVKTTCGCSRLSFSSRTIKPGTHVTLTARVIASDAADRAAQITLVPEQAELQPTVLRVIARPRVTAPLVISPDYLWLGSLSQTQASSRFLVRTIEDAQSAPWIRGVISESNELRCAIDEVKTKDRTAETVERTYAVVVEAAGKPGRSVVPIRLHDRAGLAIKQMRLEYELIPPLMASPDVIYATLKQEQDEPLVRRVLARNESGILVRLDLVSEVPSWLDVQLQPRQSNSLQVIELHLDPRALPTGEYSTEVVFATDSTAVPTLKIPVRLLVEPGQE